MTKSEHLSLARRPGNLGEKIPARDLAIAGFRLLVRVAGFCGGGFAGLIISVFGVQAFGLVDWGQALDPLDHPPPNKPDTSTRTGRNHSLLIALACVAGSACLIRHFGLRPTPARPMQDAAPWLALFVSLVLLYKAISRRGRIAEAVACLAAAAILYVAFGFNAPIFGGAPWLLFLLGLVLAWTALGLRRERASLIGVIMALAGVALLPALMTIEPLFVMYWLEFGIPWLIVVGFAFPLCVNIAQNLAARRLKRPTAGGTLSS
jgi:hypothetical protein